FHRSGLGLGLFRLRNLLLSLFLYCCSGLFNRSGLSFGLFRLRKLLPLFLYWCSRILSSNVLSLELFNCWCLLYMCFCSYLLWWLLCSLIRHRIGPQEPIDKLGVLALILHMDSVYLDLQCHPQFAAFGRPLFLGDPH
ncbi:MAG: hypothetical protein AAF394_03645, partial [Planctomycetota bacterium]